MTFMGRDKKLKWLAFSLYPLSFFLYSPFKMPLFVPYVPFHSLFSFITLFSTCLDFKYIYFLSLIVIVKDKKSKDQSQNNKDPSLSKCCGSPPYEALMRTHYCGRFKVWHKHSQNTSLQTNQEEKVKFNWL